MPFVLANLLIAAISLFGVTGERLKTRAFFDANNVKVGDPLILTIDFVGSADFKSLHPPALSRVVPKHDWKIDDASVKTDTYRDARRLTYRVRPMREGVLYFPSLEFTYSGVDGSERLTRSNTIPVHAKVGNQVVVAEMGEDLNELPKPPELITELELDDEDLLFAWRKALRKPSADAFAAFDFPAAKMNEATMAIREGNFTRALKLYAQLEWRTGQTAELERGIIAALALKYDNPAVELPIWRQLLRPVLKYDWRARLGILVGAVVAITLLFFVLGKLIRVLACIVLLFALPLQAETKTVETVTTNANGMVIYQKVTTSGSVSGIEPASFFNRFNSSRRKPVKITATLSSDKSSIMVGERFELTLAIDMPRYVNFDSGVQLSLAEEAKLTQLGNARAVGPLPSANPTNVIQKLVFPMRANEPFTNLTYSVAGNYSFAGDSFFFRETYPYRTNTLSAPLVVAPVPEEGKPEDFSGIIAESVGLHEYCDLLTPETNDVITITYKLRTSGYVPTDFEPRDVDFEWTQGEWRRYFVADGAAETPRLSISYYDPEAKRYKRVMTGGTRLKYK